MRRVHRQRIETNKESRGLRRRRNVKKVRQRYIHVSKVALCTPERQILPSTILVVMLISVVVDRGALVRQPEHLLFFCALSRIQKRACMRQEMEERRERYQPCRRHFGFGQA